MLHIIQDAFAITYSKGLFRQVPMFHRDNKNIYIKHGSGFALVLRNGDTSVPFLRVDEFDTAGMASTYDKLGRLICAKDAK